jgi:hypothetical protein
MEKEYVELAIIRGNFTTGSDIYLTLKILYHWVRCNGKYLEFQLLGGGGRRIMINPGKP